ncbi:MAG TPA: type II toxin-antitoxin system RelE/ParE family toxin [Thermoanaerobaculia bacterium]|nr:type II toxin-antitoxin system RelE/ParE family toxin [Thermoanaerobaculia bacterium]
MRIVWSPLAIKRAYEAAAYIAGDKPDAALRWLDGLFSVTDRLEAFPESGRVVPEIGLPEYREVVYRHSYRVIYRVEKNRVAILTVRNFAQLLDRSEVDG